jgi:uncharacterized membrane protein
LLHSEGGVDNDINQLDRKERTMKRTIIAAALAAAAAISFAARADTDDYRYDAGGRDPHQPQVGEAGSSYRVASADAYRPGAGESTENNVVQNQVG